MESKLFESIKITLEEHLEKPEDYKKALHRLERLQDTMQNAFGKRDPQVAELIRIADSYAYSHLR